MKRHVILVLLSVLLVFALGTKKKILIACMGDSITYGLGVKLTRETDSYPVILSRMLGADYKVVNYGVSGVTLQDEGDHPYRQTGQIAASLKRRPDYVFIMLGTNDVKPKNWNARRFYQEYLRLIEDYLTIHAQVFIMIPPSLIVNDNGEETTSLSDMKMTIYKLFGKLSQTKGVVCIDMYEEIGEQSGYFTDGIHPNVDGNRRMALKIRQDVFKKKK